MACSFIPQSKDRLTPVFFYVQRLVELGVARRIRCILAQTHQSGDIPMSEGNDPRPAIPPQLFWRMLVAGNLTTLVVLLMVAHYATPVIFMPEAGVWLFLAGLASMAPALLYQRRLARKERERAPGAISANARAVEQLREVILGLALAELPGLLGIAYYLFSHDRAGIALLFVACGVLTWQSKPRD
jgi:hypothetical protein